MLTFALLLIINSCITENEKVIPTGAPAAPPVTILGNKKRGPRAGTVRCKRSDNTCTVIWTPNGKTGEGGYNNPCIEEHKDFLIVDTYGNTVDPADAFEAKSIRYVVESVDYSDDNIKVSYPPLPTTDQTINPSKDEGLLELNNIKCMIDL